jgi:glycosyltransferase involved in cell wall biosynthesis
MNILFLADPNSVHDVKWMAYLAEGNTCGLIVRRHHAAMMGPEKLRVFEQTQGLKVLAVVDDFSIRHFARTWKTAKHLAAIIRTNRIDVIHLMYAEPNALWAVFKRTLGVPMMLTTRGTDVLRTIPSFFQQGGLLNRAIMWCYRKALRNFDEVTCTSTRQQSAVRELSGAVGRSAHLIRTGVPVDRVLADTSEHLPKELAGQRYVFFPRPMRAICQHELALDALELLPTELRTSTVFVFVDRDSASTDYTQRIQGLVDRSTALILWLPQQQQAAMFELYKKALLVVMTPLSDGSPVSALEALLCKVPVILPPLQYDADLFGESTLQFPEWTGASLASLMEKTLSGSGIPDPEIGYRIVLERADTRKEMNKVRSLYGQMISRSKEHTV